MDSGYPETTRSTTHARRAFRRFRDGLASSRRARRFERIFRRLERSGIRRRDLYLAWHFTVASRRSLSGRMLWIRNRAFAGLGDRDLGDLRVEGSAPPFTVTGSQDMGDVQRVLGRQAAYADLTPGVGADRPESGDWVGITGALGGPRSDRGDDHRLGPPRPLRRLLGRARREPGSVCWCLTLLDIEVQAGLTATGPMTGCVRVCVRRARECVRPRRVRKRRACGRCFACVSRPSSD
jgi:hypothetical protein